MADSVMKWYVVRAIGGQENKVKSYIETEISRLGLSDFVSQVLVPKEKVIQIRDGKKINKETTRTENTRGETKRKELGETELNDQKYTGRTEVEFLLPHESALFIQLVLTYLLRYRHTHGPTLRIYSHDLIKTLN